MCEYCDLENYEQSTLKEGKYIIIGISHVGINSYYLDVDTDLDGGENLEINYCPMCGRKLVEE